VPDADLLKFVDAFADCQHANWVFTMQSDGWVYNPVLNKKRHHHPNIRPYEMLDRQVQLRVNFQALKTNCP
jgi:hypothetical protein